MVKLSYDERCGSRSLADWGFGDSSFLGLTDLEKVYLDQDVESDYEKSVRLGIVGVDDL